VSRGLNTAAANAAEKRFDPAVATPGTINEHEPRMREDEFFFSMLLTFQEKAP
jgi:hypothetical protein